MASGDSIIRSNFPTAVASTYNSGETHTSPIYVYASAPSIYVHCSCNSVFLRSASFSCRCYYYNWGTGAWTYARQIAGSCSGASADDDYFYHNWGSSESHIESKGYHLWKFYFTSSTPGSCTARIIVQVKGIGGMNDETYVTYCKGKKIISAGRLGSDWLHATTSASDDYAVDLFRWSDNTGTQLDYSLANKMIPKYWE